MPRSLGDLQKGATAPGDCGAPHDVMPSWMDRGRFNRGREFFQRHLLGVFLSHYLALLTGFSIGHILDILLSTGKSSSIEQATGRYVSTARRLMLWHDGDVWDVYSKAHASVMTVRNMHRQVARAITTKRPESKQAFISQYDMALTQAAFIGVVLRPTKFGLRCSIAELEDYIFFWRGIGYLLGMEDEYNICSGNYAETCRIIAEIENDIIKPGLQNPPKRFDLAATSFAEGMGLYLNGGYLTTKDAMFSLVFDILDLPMYKVSMRDWCRFVFMKWMVWLVEIVPGLSTFLIVGLSAALKRENPYERHRSHAV